MSQTLRNHYRNLTQKQLSISVLRKRCSEVYSKFTGKNPSRSVVSITCKATLGEHLSRATSANRYITNSLPSQMIMSHFTQSFWLKIDS